MWLHANNSKTGVGFCCWCGSGNNVPVCLSPSRALELEELECLECSWDHSEGEGSKLK